MNKNVLLMKQVITNVTRNEVARWHTTPTPFILTWSPLGNLRKTQFTNNAKEEIKSIFNLPCLDTPANTYVSISKLASSWSDKMAAFCILQEYDCFIFPDPNLLFVKPKTLTHNTSDFFNNVYLLMIR